MSSETAVDKLCITSKLNAFHHVQLKTNFYIFQFCALWYVKFQGHFAKEINLQEIFCTHIPDGFYRYKKGKE